MQNEQKQILKSFVPPILLIAVMWAVKGVEIIFHHDFARYGVLPRHPESLMGIILMPFIHSDINHLFSNSVPLLILGASLIYFYKELALRVFLLTYLLDGVWLWLGGRENYHIGASGIVYGLSGFLFFSGLFRRDTRLIAISLLVVFLYGGMIWGIFPTILGERISWEAHLYGGMAGALCAWVYRKEGPQRKQYQWETEEDTDDEIVFIEEEPAEPTETPIVPEPPKIQYDYTPSIKPDEEDTIKPNT